MKNSVATPASTAYETSADPPYYDDAEVADLLGISVARLRNKISAGEPLPPRLQPAGIRKRFWPRKDLHDWLRRFERVDVGHESSCFPGHV